LDHTKDAINSRLCHRWHVIVMEFSGKDLSYPEDKLPALAGIAKQMHDWRGRDMYLGGMWLRTFHLDILWQALDKKGSPRSRKWRAVSWSWASIDLLYIFNYSLTLPTDFTKQHI
jgi:hypothetical protein